MLTWDKFETVFTKGGRPYWQLYQGKAKTTLIGSNMEMENIEESWQMLSELVELYGEGFYTIEVRTTPNSGRNNPVHTFQVGEAAASVGNAARPSATPTPNDKFYSGVDMRFWLEREESYRAEMRKLERDLERVRMELILKKMDDKYAQQPSGTDRILGVIERQPEILNHVIGMFTGGEQPAAIGTLKSPQKAAVPTQRRAAPAPPPPAEEEFDDEDLEDDNYEDDDAQAVELGGFSLDRAVTACYRLMQVLPEHNINDLLDQLSNTDPNKLRTAIQFL